jgi:hypothetical protein
VKTATCDFLFSAPSFVSGAARLLDLGGLYDSYNTSSTEGEANYRALLSDWCVVGQNIADAINQFEGSMVGRAQLCEQGSHSTAEQMRFFA